jgi:hypothetical protein
MNFLKNLFAPSVATLTASITKLQTRLEVLAEAEYEKANKLREQAAALNFRATLAVDEGRRASRVSGSLAKLLS